jgi:four helix bundle protein
MKTYELFPHQRTDIYQAAVALVKRLRGTISDAQLKDEAQRASVSCMLAIGEGLPHRGPRMQRQYFERAHASLCEVVTSTHSALTIGSMTDGDWHACQDIAVRVRAMLIALLIRSA